MISTIMSFISVAVIIFMAMENARLRERVRNLERRHR